MLYFRHLCIYSYLGRQREIWKGLTQWFIVLIKMFSHFRRIELVTLIHLVEAVRFKVNVKLVVYRWRFMWTPKQCLLCWWCRIHAYERFYGSVKVSGQFHVSYTWQMIGLPLIASCLQVTSAVVIHELRTVQKSIIKQDTDFRRSSISLLYRISQNAYDHVPLSQGFCRIKWM